MCSLDIIVLFRGSNADVGWLKWRHTLVDGVSAIRCY